ncbi:hypothetical protein ACQP00_19515 [Dactylosporangium sp. CS-047395]|uniref:hypothetical protein n=1 Tax=Dactylosporangium sp. CS-047395 TaxID=3239936 RepID=UPI003D934721
MMPGARTGLSPEWDRGFDAAFVELISHDHDFVDTEFTSLTTANWPAPPASPPAASSRQNQTRNDT